jgi:hypothetical protein
MILTAVAELVLQDRVPRDAVGVLVFKELLLRGGG